MLINRANYETIFLLYVDNELSAAERKIVEEFVDVNRDLGEELEVLQSTVLPSENGAFVPKTQLYKNATPVESVQESLLLMLDNELGDECKGGLLQQIEQNNEVKEEWSLLEKTVLDRNDRVVFQDKKLLYRHTSHVVPMKVWRVAAAILLGLGIFTGITLYNNNKVSDGLTVATTPVGKTTSKPASHTATQPRAEEKELVASDDPVRQRPTDGINTNAQVLIDKPPVVKDRLPKDRENVLQNKQALPDRETILARQENIVEKSTVRPVENTDGIVVTESPVKDEISNSLINDSDVGQAKNTFARLAVNEEDPDRFLNIEEDKVTRTKLGGIIRQVKRVVERNTKIKTSNGLRIGGFEIALK